MRSVLLLPLYSCQYFFGLLPELLLWSCWIVLTLFVQPKFTGRVFFTGSPSQLNLYLFFLASVSYVYSAPPLGFSLSLEHLCCKAFSNTELGDLIRFNCCRMSSTCIELCSEQEAEWFSAEECVLPAPSTMTRAPDLSKTGLWLSTLKVRWTRE